ncbi:unnamed protein product [Brassica oleracea var. botrytis]|uniref:Single-stranded DNA binding protein Ssb-like OB fold domain-containing protein n=2 Tax=Brassica TaxID=3705 RepID=A0A3P6FJJ9_BRAOL|nr:unnamed protein product [Brassica napus]CDY32308.1 BnaC01g36270D [Brassica napus]VDD52500.1 unnamed protein product [Brassica oleracea]
MAEESPALRKPVFTKVSELRPGTNGLSLNVKIGIIIFTARNDQVDLMKEGKIVTNNLSLVEYELVSVEA